MVNGDGGAEGSFPPCGTGVVKSRCVTFNVPIYLGINGNTIISPPLHTKHENKHPSNTDSAKDTMLGEYAKGNVMGGVVFGGSTFRSIDLNFLIKPILLLHKRFT